MTERETPELDCQSHDFPNDGFVLTRGRDSVGVLAQSLGGGNAIA